MFRDVGVHIQTYAQRKIIMLYSFDMLVLQQLEKKKKGRTEKERTKGSTDIYRPGIAERVWSDSHYTTEL